MIFTSDETLFSLLFNDDSKAKRIFSFLQKNNFKVNIPSNVYKKIIENPKIKEKKKAISMLDIVISPFGGDSYDNFTFEKSTINMNNVLSETADQILFLTDRNYESIGLSCGEELTNSENLLIISFKGMMNFIKFSDKRFLEWYDANELFAKQKFKGSPTE